MSIIFISHSSQDNAKAVAIAQWLESNGWSEYFLDISEDRGLQPGERWQSSIRKAAHRCEVVLLILSRSWLESKWCLAEMLLARQIGKQLCGLIVEDVPLDELPIELTSEWQLCDLVSDSNLLEFQVERLPFVENTTVSYSEAGLAALKRGLERAGQCANDFPWPPKEDPNRQPYLGLRSHTSLDAAVFFGRDDAIAKGLSQLRKLHADVATKLMIVLGASGAGKSSYLAAGLWPRLMRDARRFYPLPIVRPGRSAINGERGLVASLSQAFIDLGESSIRQGDVRQRLNSGDIDVVLPTILGELVQCLATRTQQGDSLPQLVIMLDQAEELYSGSETAESLRLRKGIAACLMDCVSNSGSLCIVITAIRTDFYEKLQSDETLRAVERETLDLMPMDRADYREVIEGPARVTSLSNAKFSIDGDLVEALLVDSGGADALPTLALTLERLFNEFGSSNRLRLEDYLKLGGIAAIVETAVWNAMSDPEHTPVIPRDRTELEALLRASFIPGLAEIDELTGERRRRIARTDELPVTTLPIIERLTKARLLVRSVNAHESAPVVEVAHEALLRQWPLLVTWLDADEDALKTIGSVSRAADLWRENHRADDYLSHVGDRLQQAQSLLERSDFQLHMTESSLEYLKECQKQEDAEERNRLKRNRILKTSLTIMGLLALVTSLLLIQARSLTDSTREALTQAETAKVESEIERERANESKNQALRNLSLLHSQQALTQVKAGSYRVGVLLAMESTPPALGTDNNLNTHEPARALHYALSSLRGYRFLEGLNLSSADRVSISGDGTKLLSTAGIKTAAVWSLDTTEKPTLLNSAIRFSHVGAALNANGALALTLMSNRTLTLWDTVTGTQIYNVQSRQDKIMEILFSPDGKKFAISSYKNNELSLWDTASGKRLSIHRARTGAVRSMQFDTNGERLLISSSDGFAGLWLINDGMRFIEIETGSAQINGAIFRPNSSEILTYSSDGYIRLFDSLTLKKTYSSRQYSGAFSYAQFSNNGKKFITRTVNNELQFWWRDRKGTWLVESPYDYTGKEVKFAYLSNDGNLVLVGIEDENLDIFHFDGFGILERINMSKQHISNIRFGPNGDSIIFFGSHDDHPYSAATIIDFHPKLPIGLTSLPEKFESLILGHLIDGTPAVLKSLRLANNLFLFSAETNKPIATLKDVSELPKIEFFGDSKKHVAIFSPSKKRLRIQNFNTGTELLNTHFKNSPVYELSSSGHYAYLKEDNSIAFGHVSDKSTNEIVTAKSREIAKLALSEDARLLAWKTSDEIVIWDTQKNERLGALQQTSIYIDDSTLVFSPDKKYLLATDSLDSLNDKDLLNIWKLDTMSLHATLPIDSDPVDMIAFSEDGRNFATAFSQGSIIRLWSLESQQIIYEFPVAKEIEVSGLAFSKHENHLIAVGQHLAMELPIPEPDELLKIGTEASKGYVLTAEQKKEFYVIDRH